MDERVIFIFIFGTEKMSVYKVSTGEQFTTTRVDVPPLVENRVVYSISSEWLCGERPGTGAEYVILAGGVKPDDSVSDAIDVYKFDRNEEVQHIASGRLGAPAETLRISYRHLGWFGWFNIGPEKWALDFPSPEETVFKRLNG